MDIASQLLEHDRHYELIARLRERQPLLEGSLRQAAGLPPHEQFRDVPEVTTLTFALSRHVLTNPKLFSSRAYGASMDKLHGAPTILTMDPPAHKAHRDLVSLAFFAESVQQWAARRVPAILDRLLDAIVEQGTSSNLVTDLTSIFPIQVIIDIVGVPESDWPMILDCVNHQIGAPDDLASAERASATIRAYLKDLVAQRRKQPREDLASTLIAAEVEGERLTEASILAFLNLLLMAGGETTIRAIGTTMFGLLGNPDQLDLVRRDPARIALAFEEGLRWDNPVQMVRRVAVQDVELGGMAVAAGTHVSIHLGAANRDPERWDDPDRFDIRRAPRPHLSFASGPHYCLGVNLARFEALEAIRMILERLPNLRLAPGSTTLIRGFELRGPLSLEVEFDPPAPRRRAA